MIKNTSRSPSYLTTPVLVTVMTFDRNPFLAVLLIRTDALEDVMIKSPEKLYGHKLIKNKKCMRIQKPKNGTTKFDLLANPQIYVIDCCLALHI